MNNNIKFSIMTPVYKVERYLPECIESVLGQTYGNFEFILVDDGSPDHSGEICDEYAKRDGRIRVFHKENGGPVMARLFALDKACGEYNVFLDSDDYLELNDLEILNRHIAESGADCIIYGFKWLKPGRTEEVVCKDCLCGRRITDKRGIYNIVLNNEGFNMLWRKCVKSTCFDGRDHSRHYHIKRGEDLLQSLEILENAGSFLFIPETLYCYRVNPASITHSDSYEGYRANFEVREAVLEFLGKSGVFTEEDYDRLRNNDMDRVAVELKRICRYAPTREAKRAAIASIRDSAYYKHFLEPGYRPASPLPGDERPDGLRAFTNRLTAKLLAARRYDAIITLNGLMYKTAKALGAR